MKNQLNNNKFITI